MFGVLMRLWAWYAGEQSSITDESGLAINDSLMSKPLEASEMAQLVNLYSNGLMSKQTVLEELQRGGVLDPDLVVRDELERIDEDHVDQQEQMLEDGDMKLEQDLKRAEEFQKVAPKQPVEPKTEQVPGKKTEQVPGKKTEQDKTAQAAKVAQ